MTDCECPGYARLREALAYNASANRIDECVFPSRARTCLTRADRHITAAILELGALFGALSAGIYADRYSRRHAMFIACCAYHLHLVSGTNLISLTAVFCLGSLFQCAAQSLSYLFIGRAIGGIGVGALRYAVNVCFFSLAPEHCYNTALYHPYTWQRYPLLNCVVP